jgi:integrase
MMRKPVMSSMSQLTLFSSETDAAPPTSGSCRLDPVSERLLASFQDVRLAQGAHPRSARRETSQIRAVMRDAGMQESPTPLRDVFADPSAIARALTEPTVPIARSTGRTRLLAVQRFIMVMGAMLKREPVADLAALDVLLPAHRSAGWHTAGAMVACAPGRRRRRGPTLDAIDLRRIVDAAGGTGGSNSVRDRALVALHCFSGLRPEEIVRLRWEDLATELSASGHFGLTASVGRNGRRVSLILPEPAADAVMAHARSLGGTIESLSGPVFSPRGAAGQPLSYRAARDVLQDACRQVGLPLVDAASLRAACAHWLRSQGLSDHEVAAVLGLVRVRSVDRLLRHHVALDAQRTVREMLKG